MDQELIILENN